MSKKKEIDDRMIAEAVGSVRYRVPELLDARVSAALERERKVRKTWKQSIWYPVSAVLTAALVAVLLLVQPGGNVTAPPEEPISEIKMEMELADQNIKIIWVQKKDFKLN